MKKTKENLLQDIKIVLNQGYTDLSRDDYCELCDDVKKDVCAREIELFNNRHNSFQMEEKNQVVNG